ncbi:MAG: amidohydrolase family protein [Dehalococcoidia bacterium]
MATTLIRGKYVIVKTTGPDSAEVVSDGAVLQQDGEILQVGNYSDLRAQNPTVEVIGSPDYVVIPGLVNDHFHVGLTPFQLGAPDLPLEMWSLARMGVRSVNHYLDQLYGAVQMIESGTTTVQAIHSPGRGGPPVDLDIADQVLRAYQDSGMRVSYAPSIADQNSMVAGPNGGEEDFAAQLPGELAERYRTIMGRSYRSTEEVMGILEEICAKYASNQHERIQITLAPSNVHRCTDPLLAALKDLATKYQTGIHIHLQETVYQKLYGLQAWNKTPLQHLHDLGFLGPEVTCGHSVWATDDDIALMAATGTNVCHNASSNLRLQSGIAPLGRLLNSGIRVAIGSDEAGLNDDKDLFQEMRLVLKLHRVPGIDHRPPTSYQVLEMATVNGAYASWFGDRIGTLEPGKRADLVLLNLQNIEEPYLDPEVSIVDAVVHRGRSMDVDTVMVDGEVIMRDRKLTRVDKEALFKEIRSSLDRPLTAIEADRRDLSRQAEPFLRKFYEGTMPPMTSPHTHYNART